MREDGGNAEAPRTLDVHEVRVGGLYEALQLVLLRLGLSRGVEEIDSERHNVFCLRGVLLSRKAKEFLCATSENERWKRR